MSRFFKRGSRVTQVRKLFTLWGELITNSMSLVLALRTADFVVFCFVLYLLNCHGHHVNNTESQTKPSPVSSLPSPVNFLDHTQHKGLVGAVFGGLFCRLVVVVLAKNPLPFTEDPAPENKGVEHNPSLHGDVKAVTHRAIAANGAVIVGLLDWQRRAGCGAWSCSVVG